MFLSEREKEGLSAHVRIAIAKTEKQAKMCPLALFERAAEVAQYAGKDRIYIDGKVLVAAAKKAARQEFPGVKFSGTCKQGYGPRLIFSGNVEREEVLKAVGRLATNEGNESDIQTDYFDRYGRIEVNGVSISFETLSVWESHYL